MKNRKLAALLASGSLLLGMMAASAGVVSADGQISWTGQGTTDGVLNTEQCDPETNEAYLLFVFTPGGGDSITGGTLHLGGSGSGDYAIAKNGQWKATTPYFDLDTLTATLDYTGGLGNGNANLVISHGCAGETESPPPSFEQSEEGQTDAPSVPVTDAPSFEQSEQGETDAPSEPETSALGANGTSAPADGAWLLVVALGVLLASIVVLTPARAKGKR